MKAEDIEGFDTLSDNDKQAIRDFVKSIEAVSILRAARDRVETTIDKLREEES